MSQVVTPDFGHNRLNFIAQRIKASQERIAKGGEEWVEGSLELAAAFREGRDTVPSDISFSYWLKSNNLDSLPAHERAALIRLGQNGDLFRTILGETKSRSYELIWRQCKGRFASARKPPGRKRKPRQTGVRDIHRGIKLGKQLYNAIKMMS